MRQALIPRSHTNPGRMGFLIQVASPASRSTHHGQDRIGEPWAALWFVRCAEVERSTADSGHPFATIVEAVGGKDVMPAGHIGEAR